MLISTLHTWGVYAKHWANGRMVGQSSYALCILLQLLLASWVSLGQWLETSWEALLMRKCLTLFGSQHIGTVWYEKHWKTSYNFAVWFEMTHEVKRWNLTILELKLCQVMSGVFPVFPDGLSILLCLLWSKRVGSPGRLLENSCVDPAGKVQIAWMVSLRRAAAWWRLSAEVCWTTSSPSRFRASTAQHLTLPLTHVRWSHQTECTSEQHSTKKND